MCMLTVPLLSLLQSATRRVVFYCIMNRIASVYSVRSLPSATTSCSVDTHDTRGIFTATINRDIGDTGIVT